MRAQATSAVIEFPLDRVRPAAGPPRETSAEVLIFTGVRVERMYDLSERLVVPAWAATGGGDIEVWLR